MSYKVRALPAGQYWELHIEGVGVTQAHNLAGADGMIRDYLELDGHEDANTAEIQVSYDLGGLEDRAAVAREGLVRAAEAQESAGQRWRAVAADLRAAGLSVADTAVVMGITRARVAQLMKATS